MTTFLGSRKLSREIQDSLYSTCEFNSLASVLALGVNPWSMHASENPGYWSGCHICSALACGESSGRSPPEGTETE